MHSTQNIMRKSLGSFEYAKLVDSADQIKFFGKSVKDFSKEELLAALVLAMQSAHEREEHAKNHNNLKHLPANNQIAGLW